MHHNYQTPTYSGLWMDAQQTPNNKLQIEPTHTPVQGCSPGSVALPHSMASPSAILAVCISDRVPILRVYSNANFAPISSLQQLETLPQAYWPTPLHPKPPWKHLLAPNTPCGILRVPELHHKPRLRCFHTLHSSITPSPTSSHTPPILSHTHATYTTGIHRILHCILCRVHTIHLHMKSTTALIRSSLPLQHSDVYQVYAILVPHRHTPPPLHLLPPTLCHYTSLHHTPYINNKHTQLLIFHEPYRPVRALFSSRYSLVYTWCRPQRTPVSPLPPPTLFHSTHTHRPISNPLLCSTPYEPCSHVYTLCSTQRPYEIIQLTRCPERTVEMLCMHLACLFTAHGTAHLHQTTHIHLPSCVRPLAQHHLHPTTHALTRCTERTVETLCMYQVCLFTAHGTVFTCIKTPTSTTLPCLSNSTTPPAHANSRSHAMHRADCRNAVHVPGVHVHSPWYCSPASKHPHPPPLPCPSNSTPPPTFSNSRSHRMHRADCGNAVHAPGVHIHSPWYYSPASKHPHPPPLLCPSTSTTSPAHPNSRSHAMHRADCGNAVHAPGMPVHSP